ncbi:MAG TPA: serine/threonine-protein kinase, partial [Polyangiaceae bacterium]
MGRYDIFGEIASGGMASVYFARQGGPSGFSRTVAIKRAHPHLSRDPDFALMFLDEARLASRIRHPNVVSTIDVLQTSSDLALVMDYVHGESLWKLMSRLREREERVPLPVAAAILVDALHGLHAAHEATDERGEPLGIVHRDVSPQNILVGTDGITRLVDFGIAKAAGRLHSTKDSSVKGKFAYMAPEQVRGEPVSRLTDTYAASIVLWELVTGERLFVGKSDAETIHKCLVARARPPSMFHPDLPRAIDDIVKRGLSREPAKRYQTARELALDIEACVPAIRPSEVGAWVERVAGDTLAARGRLLSDIERGAYDASAGEAFSSPPDRPSMPTRV